MADNDRYEDDDRQGSYLPELGLGALAGAAGGSLAYRASQKNAEKEAALARGEVIPEKGSALHSISDVLTKEREALHTEREKFVDLNKQFFFADQEAHPTFLDTAGKFDKSAAEAHFDKVVAPDCRTHFDDPAHAMGGAAWQEHAPVSDQMRKLKNIGAEEALLWERKWHDKGIVGKTKRLATMNSAERTAYNSSWNTINANALVPEKKWHDRWLLGRTKRYFKMSAQERYAYDALQAAHEQLHDPHAQYVDAHTKYHDAEIELGRLDLEARNPTLTPHEQTVAQRVAEDFRVKNVQPLESNLEHAAAGYMVKAKKSPQLIEALQGGKKSVVQAVEHGAAPKGKVGAAVLAGVAAAGAGAFLVNMFRHKPESRRQHQPRPRHASYVQQLQAEQAAQQQQVQQL